MILYLLIAAILFGAACATPLRAPVLFNGTFYPNESESTMLPGQQVQKDMIAVMEDDGSVLRTLQTFTTNTGRKARYVWKGRCDGIHHPAQGVSLPAVVMLSCRRTEDGALVIKLADNFGYSHVERCSMSADQRKQTCNGTASLPDGTQHTFVYVFDRR
jgi:hypothetical protein